MISAVLYVIIFKFGEIRDFRFFSLGFSLKETIREANETLYSLRRLASALGDATISCIASTQLSAIEKLDAAYCHEIVENIRSIVNSVDGQINELAWKRYCSWRYVYMLPTKKNRIKDLAIHFEQFYNDPSFVYELNSFLKKEEILYDQTIYDQLFYFIKNNKHKDPSMFLYYLKNIGS